jgi:hypothetical protein
VATEGATEPKPTLVQLFEAVAAIMELDGGLTRVELEFDGGHLRRWSAHDERNGRGLAQLLPLVRGGNS